MPVYLRPTSTTLTASVSNASFGTTGTNLFAPVSETIPDDTTYVTSTANPLLDVVVYAITSGTDPIASGNHIVRFRVQKDSSGAQGLNVACELRQSYVSETSLGTLIAKHIADNISDTAKTYNYRLTGAEADAITDYTALSLRFVFIRMYNGGGPRSGRLLWTEVQVPTTTDGNQSTALFVAPDEIIPLEG